MNGDEVAAIARGAFGWGDTEVSVGPRGALGQLFQVRADGARYAVKEIFDEPPTEESIAAELVIARCATAAGARVPAPYRNRSAEYLTTTPHGTWLRCHEWMDLRPVDRTAPDTPGRIGRLLAGMHRAAPAALTEPYDGTPPDRWYDQLPDASEWAAVMGTELDFGPTTRVDHATLLLCHRDLHPQNVFQDESGTLVVVDCDDVGPAEPGRELARVAFDWFCTREAADVDAVRVLFETYLAAGGPGRIASTSDFTMLLACRLNFMLAQARLASDVELDARRRDWAKDEYDEMVRLMPTPAQLDEVLAVARSTW